MVGEEGNFFSLNSEFLLGMQLVESVFGHEGSAEVEIHGETVNDQRLDGVASVAAGEAQVKFLTGSSEDSHLGTLLCRADVGLVDFFQISLTESNLLSEAARHDIAGGVAGVQEGQGLGALHKHWAVGVVLDAVFELALLMWAVRLGDEHSRI